MTSILSLLTSNLKIYFILYLKTLHVNFYYHIHLQTNIRDIFDYEYTFYGSKWPKMAIFEIWRVTMTSIHNILPPNYKIYLNLWWHALSTIIVLNINQVLSLYWSYSLHNQCIPKFMYFQITHFSHN